MKKVALLFATVCLWGFAQAQESVIKISGIDAPFGKYELSYERTFNEGMNNIKSSGKMRKQVKWPNILTKGSFQVTFGYINHTHTQTFGNGLTAVIDTNSNHHPFYDPSNPDFDDQRVNDESSLHSVERSVVAKTSGFALEAEYRSYFKTYKQNIGDPPRGWYIAPFARVQMTTLDFDDNTLQEVNHAMNYLMAPTSTISHDMFVDYDGPWEGGEETSDPTAENYGYYNLNGALFTTPNAGNSVLYDILGNPKFATTWYDVSFKQKETVIVGGLAIGRQWLFGDKLSLDLQIGPQYKIVTRSERVFNGNDTWNLNQQIDNTAQIANEIDPGTGSWLLFTKYGDVYSFDGSIPDIDVATGYFGIIDEAGNNVIINGKGDDHALNHTSGFYRELPGLTDFGKLETYRLKIRLGYAF